jgi:hypothetical protein
MYVMELSVRGNRLDDRNWSKRPLFSVRRRRYGHWVLLLVLILIGVVLFLFPNWVNALRLPFWPAA